MTVVHKMEGTEVQRLQTKIFAHRGASRLAPENTMAAFEIADVLESEGMETDVHLTKDDIPVLIHDEKVNRTTNGVGYIKDYPFNELRQLDAGSWFSKAFRDTPILSLEEFLKWSKSKSFSINLELKNNKIDYKNLEFIVYEMIVHFGLQERIILSTFNSESIKRMRHMNSELGVAFLTSKRNRNLVKNVRDLGANALHIKYRLLKSRLMQEAQHENMSVRVYTVNKKPPMFRCFKAHCSGIITDVPDDGIKYREQFYLKNK